jgi:hypothetical protein
MAHSTHHVTEDELAGHWVAVHGSASADGSPLPSGSVIVDYDTELDLLCQRVAAAGQSGLTIYRYPEPHGDFLAPHGHYMPGHLPGSRGRA